MIPANIYGKCSLSLPAPSFKTSGVHSRIVHILTEYCNIFGEPDVKGAAKESKMRETELTEAMAVAVDCLMNARESTSTLNRVVETIVDTIGRFNERMQRDT